MSAEPIIIPLEEVFYDARASDGTWCLRPYSGYPKGCPNFVKGCPQKRLDFLKLNGHSEMKYDWFAVIEEYDIDAWEKKQHKKHPFKSRRWCRNPRHWQKGVMSRLLKKAQAFHNAFLSHIILDIPEASGVNVLATMARAGWFIQMHDPKTIRKVMLVGKPSKGQSKTRVLRTDTPNTIAINAMP